MDQFAKRLKNPVFLAAFAGFTYQILKNYGIAPSEDMWLAGFDLLTYALIGTGIYSSYGEGK